MADETEELIQVGTLPNDLSEHDGHASPSPASELASEPTAAPRPTDATATTVAKPDTIRCPRCGAANANSGGRCVECGYRFTLRCPSCGAVNRGEATACHACGHRLISAAYGAWTVGPQSPRALSRRGARHHAVKRRGLRSRPQAHSPLFFMMLATGVIALALGILILILLVAQNPGVLDGLRRLLPIGARDGYVALARRIRWP